MTTHWIVLGLLLIGLLIALGGAAPLARGQGGCTVPITPSFTEYYGDLTLDGGPAPIGALVEAYNTAGVRAGCFIVGIPGIYGYMRVYGADPDTGTPGMAPNEAVTFKVNAAVASSSPSPVLWSGDKGQHEVDLSAASLPAAVNDLAAGKVANGLQLTWSHVGGSIDHYEVWRGAAPYFAPGGAGSERIAASIPPPAHAGDPLSFTDTTDHLGDPAVNDYYVVLAIDTRGQASLASNRVGACDFALQPGESAARR